MSDDKGGFEGYETTTIDPGLWVNLGTALFCVLSIVIFPCLVAGGRKYDRRRRAIHSGRNKEDSQDKDDDEERSPGPYIMSAHSTSLVSCLSDLECESKPPQPPAARTEKAGGRLHRLIDNIIIPPYPDDVSLACGLEIALMSGKTELADDDSLMSFAKILDAAGPANRHRRYQQGLKEKKWEKEQLVLEHLKMRNMSVNATMYQSLMKAAQEREAKTPAEDDRQDTEKEKTLVPFQWKQLSCVSDGLQRVNDDTVQISPPQSPPPRPPPRSPRKIRHDKESYPSIERVLTFESSQDRLPSSSQMILNNELSLLNVNDSQNEWVEEMVVLPNDAVDSDDAGDDNGQAKLHKEANMEGDNVDLCRDEHAWWQPSTIAAGFDRLLDVANFDKEMRRFVALAVPISLAASSEGAFETVRVALVANYIGTDAVGAYTIVMILLGLVYEFLGGFTYSCASLCSHAVGVENFFQAGQYVQISSVLYSLFMMPNALVWFFLTDEVVQLFGFDETTSQMAQVFARYYVVKQWIMGLEEAYGSLLCLIERERFFTFMVILDEILSTCIILGLVLTRSTTLEDIGLVELCSQAFSFGLTLLITNWLGWLGDYTKGIFKANGLRNRLAVRTVLNTSLPIAFGQLLTYGEWEVLTIFVAYLGPAEVTAWGIVGSLWDTLEMLTDGFGDAGEIRTGFHLGAARPAAARLSSYKTILVSVMFACTITSILWILGENLATWLTPDPTLQGLIIDVLPLMGLGNIAMTSGSVSWALIGAQGRYRLATFAASVSSWCITLPLAATFVYGLNLNLQGPVSAVVIGYSVTGTCMQYILFRSDWDRLSKLIVKRNGGIISEDKSSETSSQPSSCKNEESQESQPTLPPAKPM